ncbi:MAG: T9SS type A sorting domain-containing protein [Flavobacteriales bacterium]|nr:T9SS type A sorting domain-containing protein [Flavobacteriales bacterium]
MSKKFKYFVLFIIFISVSFYATSQIYQLKYNDTILVIENAVPLNNPWAGGLNSVQVSEIDLNLDGIKDLMIFDRTGNRINPFINKGTPNQPDYKYNPEYIGNFPFLEHWALLRDYNCDGKMDIFSYAPGGIKVYKNTSVNYLSFELVTNLLLSNYQPNVINLYVTSVDIPAIDDIDGDGDLDIMTYEIFGSTVEYHRNMSMETKGNCDTLHYVLKNQCWGLFRENQLNCDIILDYQCPFNVPSPERKGHGNQGNKHSGSCVLTMETNTNTASEMIVGDIGCRYLTFLQNGGNVPNSNSKIISKDTLFPKNHNSNTIPIDMEIFPCGFYLDVNNNTKKDLIVSPNNSGTLEQENFYSVWRYNNIGQNNQPNFVLQEKNFIQSGTIEVGEGANPTLYDIDGDSLLDLIIGNYSYYDSTGGMLSFYKNTGNKDVPQFTLITRNFANIPSYNISPFNSPIRGIAPTFGDIDNDGFAEMILGDVHGNIHLFENNNGVFSLAQANYSSINVGEFATPQLFDLDGDTLLDLIIGERNGNVNYYQNTGSKTVPTYTFVTDSLGKVNAKEWWNYIGFSYPHFYKSNGSTQLILGCMGGFLKFYDNIDQNLTGSFNLVDSAYMNIKVGSRATVCGAHFVGNDTLYDVIIGNYTGGVTLFTGDYFNSVNNEYFSELDFILYPVPSFNRLNVSFDNYAFQYLKHTYKIYNLLGQEVLHGHLNGSGIDITSLQPSSYIFVLTQNGNTFYKTKKFTVIK